jgi:hypothetical protein
MAEGTLLALLDDLAVEQLLHLRMRTEFPVSPRVMRILYSLQAQLIRFPGLRDVLPAAAGSRTVDGAIFVAAKSHGFPPVGLVLENMGAVCRNVISGKHACSTTGIALCYIETRWIMARTVAVRAQRKPSKEAPRQERPLRTNSPQQHPRVLFVRS